MNKVMSVKEWQHENWIYVVNENTLNFADSYATYLKTEFENGYKPSLLGWLEEMFEHAKNKEWYETYHGFDVHGVISKPDYRKTEQVGKEFKINYYPWAKETLRFLTNHRPDMVLFLFTSSYKAEIDKYMKQFEKDGIFFKFVNENPDISDVKGSFGCYDKKPYWNSIWEDKAGFNPLKDWKPIYDYFVNSDYKPDPNWSFKTDESYHEKIKLMTFKDLTDEQLKELVILRMKNKPDLVTSLENFTITEIKIDERDKDCVLFIIKTKEWDDYSISIVFDKFFIDEIVFLQKCGINFDKL